MATGTSHGWEGDRSLSLPTGSQVHRRVGPVGLKSGGGGAHDAARAILLLVRVTVAAVTVRDPFVVRPARPADAQAICTVHIDSIMTLGARGYPPEQVALWHQPCVPQRYVDAMSRGERFFVAVAPDLAPEALGFSSYRVERSLHRIATYVAARAARRGVGTALYRAAEDLARASGASDVHVDASLVAVEFYLSLGFVELGRGSHRLRVGGEMKCVFMRKRLVADLA